MNASTMHYVNL